MANNKSIISVQANIQANAKHVSKFSKDAVANRRMNMQRMQNAISISFVASNKKLDQLDPSFMYTQILKETLSTINFEDKHIKQFITYCREAFTEKGYNLHNIEKLERDYHNRTPIWWYTSEYFLHSMLNQALRLMDVDIIVQMGFFINDLHRDIQRLHSEQFDGQQSGATFTVYRGQCLSKKDFTEMKKTKGGLLSFNNFLSTSKNPDVSLLYTPSRAGINPDFVGILFVISINPTHSTTPFASIPKVSQFDEEGEVLFSMHSIFRIGDIKPMDGNNHVYQVNLALTSDNDQDLRILTNHIRQKTFPNSTGWAQEVYEDLLYQTTNKSDKAPIYHQLGRIKRNQGEYQEALFYYEKGLTIRQQLVPSNDRSFGTFYNNIGNVHYCRGDYPKALSYYKKGLEIKQQSLPSNHPDLANSYNNIGNVYHRMGDNSKALSYHEKALAIKQQSLPSNHPDLGASYNNIGLVYENIGNYSEAHSFYDRAVQIWQKSLPSNHLTLQQRKKTLKRLEKKLQFCFCIFF
ncbi:unnamed protein product [Adineta steineri]|uniref:Uncharacterized protein n=1 Tax=Adineta steineri TaxID=433720 RepID=A0A814Z624_9BILA|nr:unnamed protein product [Adineta steineri]CAF1238695.1 unnamed protein product [Adineta steineri]CAF3848327.1 unnamed protein product [Adineta steineri]CAF3969990.1 unnamed protein product [Adineta steineri]